MAVDILNRSIKLDVFCKDDQRQPILNSIRKYRAIARQMFCISAMAEISGGSIDPENGTLHPVSEQSKKFLEATFNKVGKAHLYEMRDLIKTEMAPEWLSFVWDSLRTTVSQRWSARDPEITKASRGYLIDQGARALGFFRNIGIGFPQATARPEIREHSIFLKWTHDIGEIEFKIGKLDGGRYSHFKCIRDKINDYKPGTFYLSERDGHLFITVTYSASAKKKALDEKTELHIRFNNTDPEKFIIIGNQIVSVKETLAWLSEIGHISEKFKTRLSSCGNPNKPWGNRRGFKAVSKKLNNVTVRRTNGEKVHNHLWSRRIVDETIRSEAGMVRVFDFPEKELFGMPWNFSQLKNFIDYKISEIGGKVFYVT